MKISESEMMKIYQECSGHIPSILEELQVMGEKKEKEREEWLDNIADYAQYILDDYPEGKIMIKLPPVLPANCELNILNILALGQFTFVT